MLIFKRNERMGKEFFWETTAHHNSGGEINLTQIWYDGSSEVARNNIVLMTKELKEILTQVEKSDTIE
tara:strand:- start:4120 stop:4323 length:204 start_codon:yes stop_codon:yes gene_type:complete